MSIPREHRPKLARDVKYLNTSRVIRGCNRGHLSENRTSSINGLMTKDLLVRPLEQEWGPQRRIS